jgi:hypothetical protein
MTKQSEAVEIMNLNFFSRNEGGTWGKDKPLVSVE